jgi:hypothetical protein
MKKAVLFILLMAFLSCQTDKADNDSSHVLDNRESQLFEFPKDWIGDWKGELEIWSIDTIVQKVSMQLKISENDSCFNWNIIYGDDLSDNRPYILKVINSEEGHYEIDELNGIVLDVWKKGNTLTSAFELDDLILLISEEISEHGILYEVRVIDRKNATTTGEKNDEVDLIYNYPVVTYQKGLLKKSN